MFVSACVLQLIVRTWRLTTCRWSRGKWAPSAVEWRTTTTLSSSCWTRTDRPSTSETLDVSAAHDTNRFPWSVETEISIFSFVCSYFTWTEKQSLSQTDGVQFTNPICFSSGCLRGFDFCLILRKSFFMAKKLWKINWFFNAKKKSSLLPLNGQHGSLTWGSVEMLLTINMFCCRKYFEQFQFAEIVYFWSDRQANC